MRPRETGDVSAEVWKSKMAAAKLEASPTEMASARSFRGECRKEDLEKFCADQPVELEALSLCFWNHSHYIYASPPVQSILGRFHVGCWPVGAEPAATFTEQRAEGGWSFTHGFMRRKRVDGSVPVMVLTFCLDIWTKDDALPLLLVIRA